MAGETRTLSSPAATEVTRVLGLSGGKYLLHSDIQCLSDQYSYKQNGGVPVIQFSESDVVVTAPMFVSCSGMKNHQFVQLEKNPQCPKHFPVFIKHRGRHKELIERVMKFYLLIDHI